MYKFKIFEPHPLIQGVTTKKWGGNFKEDQPDFKPSIDRLINELKCGNPETSYQNHGSDIADIAAEMSVRPTADALITQLKNKTLMVKVADCQGVLIYDSKTKTIASIHSGWRGSAQNIIGKTIQKMIEKYECNPQDMLVGISPSLGPCCAEFTDPKNELPEFTHTYICGKNVDFWELSKKQCIDAGVPEDQIEIAAECTKCQPERFYSHRNSDTERMAVFIGLK